MCKTLYGQFVFVESALNLVKTHETRLQAVPFWIVERAREIAEHEKTGANERRGAYFSSLQSRCAVSAPSRLTRKGLLAVYHETDNRNEQVVR